MAAAPAAPSAIRRSSNVYLSPKSAAVLQMNIVTRNTATHYEKAVQILRSAQAPDRVDAKTCTQ